MQRRWAKVIIILFIILWKVNYNKINCFFNGNFYSGKNVGFWDLLDYIGNKDLPIFGEDFSE